ncbi:coproporphyrinogen dehydrogenase HemZ [Phascolarctobacterium faecium]|jgi:oxygen-independent coproporphyrinogen-3 oxidase|uniref:coproporphyrinogen dehydrogenase HemZ n=1 Tax=Phascolarctobacterium faecium TaxID=33025 RepID=UPI000B20D575|nr:coproporphyrinogen dehydrogenase HemZ [Phascolarctobacterium faecium]
MIISDYRLEQNLPYDLTRPVAEMAAFFDILPQSDSADVLKIVQEADGCVAILQTEDGTRRVSRPFTILQDVRGEWVRCVKLAVLDVLRQAVRRSLVMPWGILTGVRPGKLAHKLLDSGLSCDELPQYLERHYLLPHGQAQLLTEICLRQRQLLPAAEKQVGIYIGIPFCPTRCSYCSFPSGIVPLEEELQQKFLNFIEQDMLTVVQLLSMYSLNVTAVYIGGGTPTSLSETAFARLIALTARHLLLPGVREFTVEAGRPDCFSAEKLKVMEACGVNRISVNPQTLHDKTLKAIGRSHTVQDFYRSYDLVRHSGIKTVNTDLIIGLPGETADDVRASLDGIRALAPDNLTVHTLTLKKSAPIFGAQFSSLTAEDAEALVAYGSETAAAMGMLPYYLYRQHYMLGNLANIGYAASGSASLYNIQMMEERHVVLGIGPASATKVPQADGHHLKKLNMPKDIGAYTGNLPQLAHKRSLLFADEEE